MFEYLQKNKDSTPPLASPSTVHVVEQPGGGFAPVSLTTGSLNPSVSAGISLLSMPLQSPSSESLSMLESQDTFMMQQSPKLTSVGSPRATASSSQSPRDPSPSGSPRGQGTASRATASASASSLSGLDILSSVAHDKLAGIKPVPASVKQSQQAPAGKVIAQVSQSQAQQQKRLVVSKQQGASSASVATPGGISIIGSPEQKASKIVMAQTSPSQIPPGAKVIQTGTKPVAFSLLQSQNISKILEGGKGQGQIKQVSTGIPNQTTKTVVFASKSGTQGSSQQQLLATLKQGPEKVVSVISSPEGTTLPAPALMSPSSTQDSKPVLARLISHSGAPQVITLSGGQKVVSSALRLPQGK